MVGALNVPLAGDSQLLKLYKPIDSGD